MSDVELHKNQHGGVARIEVPPESVAALVAEGWMVALSPEAHAARFYAEGFEELLVSRFGVSRSTPSDHVLREIEDLYGQPAPAELAQLLRLRGSAHLGWCNFGEWRIWPDDLVELDTSDGNNTFEQLLTGFAPYAVQLFLTDLVPLGTAGNGDGYLANLDPLQPHTTPVWFYDHETGELSPFADAISTLAELNRLYVRNGDPSGKGDVLVDLERGMRRLKDRVGPSWHYSDVVKNSGVQPVFELRSATPLFWYRTHWITTLLGGDVAGAGKLFERLVDWHTKHMSSWAEASAYRTVLLPSRGLYWLFTTYFHGSDVLPDVIAVLRDSPSRVVRDAAALFGEIAAGTRTHVGALDFKKLQQRFQALGLDPARAEERRRAEAERKERLAAERRAEIDRAQHRAAALDPAGLAAELWRELDRPATVRVLAEALAERLVQGPTALLRARAVADRTTGWELALEALSRGTTPEERAFLAFAVARSGPWSIAAAMSALDPIERARVVTGAPGLLAELRSWTRATYGKQYAIRALSTLGLLSAEELGAFVERLRWTAEDRGTRAVQETAPEVVETAFGPLYDPAAVAPDVVAEPAAEAAEDDEPDAEEEEVEEEEQEEDDEPEDDEPEDDEQEDASTEEEDEDEEEEDEAPEEEPADPDERPAVELDDEDPLVATPEYLRSITDKEPLRAAIEALAATGAETALPTLALVVSDGPAEGRVPALIAAAGLPGDDARRLVEQHLGGPLRRVALVALARRRDPAALPAVEQCLAGFGGLPWLTVFEQTMREAVRSAAGLPVDLDVPRLALRTVMDNKFAAIELHEVALDLVARYGSPDEVHSTGLLFLDAEQARVRAVAARMVAGDVRVLDAAEVARIHAVDGVAGLRAALADPRAVHRDVVIRFAAEHGLLADVEQEAVAWVLHQARMPYYTNSYERDGHPRLAAAIGALFALSGPRVDDALRQLLSSPSPMVRKPFAYQNALVERLGSPSPSVLPDAPLAPATELGAPRFVLGQVVHGIGFTDRAVVVAGAGRVVVLDREGRLLPATDGLAQGWAYDVDVHRAANRLVVGYSHGHCFVYDATTFERLTELRHGGMTGVRKVKVSPDGRLLATACDDQTVRIWDLATFEAVRVHQEPYDVNTVAWVDDDTLVFGTDQHVGVVGRADGEARRVATGAVAEVQVVDGRIVAGTTARGIVFLDPATLGGDEALPVTGVARIRLSPDRKTVFVACWSGDHAGFSRWDRASRTGVRVTTEELFGMEIDPHDGRILIGGNSGRVTVLTGDGHLVEAAPVLRLDRPGGWMVPPPGNDAIAAIRADGETFDVLDAGGRRTRYRSSDGLSQPLGAPPGPLPRAAEAVAGTVVAAFDGLVGASWARATQRCEQVVAFGDQVVASSGRNLGWFDAATGALLDERPAGIGSTWVNWMIAVDADRFVVAGYDEARIQLWSASERRRVGEMRTEHRHDDGRFARPYGIAVHRPSRRLVVSTWDNQVDVFRVDDDRFVHEHTLVFHTPFAQALLSPGGDRLIGANEREVFAFGFPSCAPLWRWSTTRKITAVDGLADGRAAVGTGDGAVLVVGLG